MISEGRGKLPAIFFPALELEAATCTRHECGRRVFSNQNSRAKNRHAIAQGFSFVEIIRRENDGPSTGTE